MADGLIVRRGKYVIPEVPLETGLIVMWYGLSTAVPEGYALCDGSNGTPDLRNRFVVGAGSTYSIGNTGGSANAVVVSHSHGASTPSFSSAHSHNGYYGQSNPSGTGTAGPDGTNYIPPSYGTLGSKNTSTTGGNHTHSGSYSFGTTGGSATNANLPPYRGLFYIIKVEE